MTDKRENRDLLLVLVACTILFALNFLWLLWVRHSSPDVLKSLQNSASVVILKKLLLQPVALVAIAAVWTGWMIVFIRSPRTKEDRAYGRLYIFALMLSIPFGLFMFVIFMR